MLNHFWRRWRQEYLLELRECHRYSRGKETTDTVEVGDIILLHDDALPQSFLKLARVQELITGCDGKTRGTVLKVSDGNGKTTTLRRPLQLLYPLELKCQDNYEQRAESIEQNTRTENQVARSPKPRRRAAAEARDMVSAYLVELEDPDD